MWKCDCPSLPLFPQLSGIKDGIFGFYLYCWIGNNLKPKRVGLTCAECNTEVYAMQRTTNLIDFICYRCGRVWWKDK